MNKDSGENNDQDLLQASLRRLMPLDSMVADLWDWDIQFQKESFDNVERPFRMKIKFLNMRLTWPMISCNGSKSTTWTTTSTAGNQVNSKSESRKNACNSCSDGGRT